MTREVRRLTSAQGRNIAVNLPEGATVLAITRPSVGATVLHVLADWEAPRTPPRCFTLLQQSTRVPSNVTFVGLVQDIGGGQLYAFEVM